MADITTIAQSVAIIAACWAIISGVGAWKREFIGKRKIELAENVLAAFFEINDAIAFIRNPFSSNKEGTTRKINPGETDADTNLLNRGYVVVERYEKKEDIFSKFNILKYKFMAVFGPETEEIFSDTNRIIHSIISSSRLLATHYWKRQGRVKMEADEFQKHLDEMHHHEGIFWDINKEEDEIRTKLSQIQINLEKITKPCFEEPMKTYSILTKKFWSKS